MSRATPLTHFRQPLLKTPFHARYEALMRTGQWYGWAGYRAAGIVEDEELEYFAIRNSSSLFDLSPMVKYRIGGRDAERFLNRLMVRDVAKLAPGRVHYTVWCDDDGKVIDDGTLFRLGADDFRLCCQERHLDWFLDAAMGRDVVIAEETEEVAALSLQGPTSCALLKCAGFDGIESLKPFAITEFPLGHHDHQVTVSRTGFTGDLGYELFVAPEGAEALWDRLWKAGQWHGLRAIGNVALNIARLEAGFIITNTDFVAANQAITPARRRSPFEIGLGWLVDLKKPCYFNGKRALEAELKSGGSGNVLVKLEVAGNFPAEHSLIYHRQKTNAGEVTTAAWSPTTKRSIALASLEKPYGTRIKDDLWAEIYVLRELTYHKLMMPAEVVEQPFFNPERRRATPPADF
ncbi:MAG: aminomethyltransferase family protein [Kiloniellales bacterium]